MIPSHDQILCMDSLDYMKQLDDQSIDVIITDPPWPGTKVTFGITPQQTIELIHAACQEFARLTTRLILIIGCDTDIRPFTVPKSMPYCRTIYLGRVPSAQRGSILVDCDIALVYGHRRLTPPHRVLPGFLRVRVQADHQALNPHPTKRHLDHCKFLIRHFTRPGHLVFDPFCGSGQIPVSAKLLGRHYLGVDKVAEYCEYARRQLEKVDCIQTELERQTVDDSCCLQLEG